MEKIKKFLYACNYGLKNYIFRFLSCLDLPNLSVSNLYKTFNNTELIVKHKQNKSCYKITDLTNNIVFRKFYITKGISVKGKKQMFIGKFKENNKKIIPFPYILLKKGKTLFNVSGYKYKIKK